MKNVLVLTSTYPLNEKDTQPGFVASLCREIVNSHRVHVLAPSIKGISESQGNDERIRITRYRYFFAKFELLCGRDGMLENLKRHPWLYSLIPLMMLCQLYCTLKICARDKIDTIHAHWIIPQGFIAALVKVLRRGSIKLMITSHGGDLFAVNGWPIRYLKKWILQSADQITVVSSAMKRHVVDYYGVQANRINVVPMGVNLSDTFTPSGAKDDRKLVFVGRLAEKKGVDVLLRAAAELKSKGYSYSLDLIGGGYMIDAYRRLTSELAISECVTFHGALPNHEVVPFLRSAAVAVFPFRVAESGDQEGLGLTMVEAMGCECLTISTSLPAVKDVIHHGKTGLLVRPNCVDELTQTIAQALEENTTWQTIPKAAREYVVENFNWDVVGAEYSRLLEEM